MNKSFPDGKYELNVYYTHACVDFTGLVTNGGCCTTNWQTTPPMGCIPMTGLLSTAMCVAVDSPLCSGTQPVTKSANTSISILTFPQGSTVYQGDIKSPQTVRFLSREPVPVTWGLTPSNAASSPFVYSWQPFNPTTPNIYGFTIRVHADGSAYIADITNNIYFTVLSSRDQYGFPQIVPTQKEAAAHGLIISGLDPKVYTTLTRVSLIPLTTPNLFYIYNQTTLMYMYTDLNNTIQWTMTPDLTNEHYFWGFNMTSGTIYNQLFSQSPPVNLYITAGPIGQLSSQVDPDKTKAATFTVGSLQGSSLFSIWDNTQSAVVATQLSMYTTDSPSPVIQNVPVDSDNVPYKGCLVKLACGGSASSQNVLDTQGKVRPYDLNDMTQKWVYTYATQSIVGYAMPKWGYDKIALGAGPSGLLYLPITQSTPNNSGGWAIDSSQRMLNNLTSMRYTSDGIPYPITAVVPNDVYVVDMGVDARAASNLYSTNISSQTPQTTLAYCSGTDERGYPRVNTDTQCAPWCADTKDQCAIASDAFCRQNPSHPTCACMNFFQTDEYASIKQVFDLVPQCKTIKQPQAISPIDPTLCKTYTKTKEVCTQGQNIPSPECWAQSCNVAVHNGEDAPLFDSNMQTNKTRCADSINICGQVLDIACSNNINIDKTVFTQTCGNTLPIPPTPSKSASRVVLAMGLLVFIILIKMRKISKKPSS